MTATKARELAVEWGISADQRLADGMAVFAQACRGNSKFFAELAEKKDLANEYYRDQSITSSAKAQLRHDDKTGLDIGMY